MRIGHINIEKPLALAPMDDVADRAFRLICREHGADIVYTEFVNCEAVIRKVRKTLSRIEIIDAERPIGLQICGSNEQSMEAAAAMAEQNGPDFVDINAGCWAKKIALRGDGAGLLRDIRKFEAVVKAVMRGTQLPVTVKTRLGWDEQSIVILDVARMLEQCGVQALTVHCRTRVQGYKGKADWSWLEKIKRASAIPLIGNGDVTTPEDVKRMFETGCDGVMIGRGAIYNPWLFERAKHFLATGEHLPEPSIGERAALCIRHLRMAAGLKGEQRAVLEHRKHYQAYLKGLRNIARLRAELMAYEDMQSVIRRIHAFVDTHASLAL